MVFCLHKTLHIFIVMDCPGCSTFSCLLVVTSILSVTEENIVYWLRAHAFGSQTPCPRCNVVPHGKVCYKRLSDGTQCRRKIPEFGHFLHRVKDLTSTFRTWMLIAQGNLPNAIALLLGRSLRAVTNDLSNIEHVFYIS